MGASWAALHADLVRSATTLGFESGFRLLRETSPALTSFTDPAAMLDWLHDQANGPERKNVVLRSLVEAAQAEDRPSPPVTLLLLALWPGLDAVYRRLRPFFPADTDTLSTELASRFAIAVRELDLARVNRIAATLLRNVERDLRRELEAHERDVAAAAERRLERAVAADMDAEVQARLLLRALRQLLGADDGALVFAVVVLGETGHEAADRLGIGPEATKKRFQRARARLRRCPDEIL